MMHGLFVAMGWKWSGKSAPYAREKGDKVAVFLFPSPRSTFFSSVLPSLFFFHSLTPTFLFSLFLTKTQKNSATNAKHVFYLSAEFLMGRSLTNAVGNLKLEDAYGEAVKVRKKSLLSEKGREKKLARTLCLRETKTANRLSPYSSTHSHKKTVLRLRLRGRRRRRAERRPGQRR